MAAKWSSRIIADSQRTADDIREILNVSPEKISVVPLAVGGEHFKPVTAPEELEHLNQLYRVHVSYVLVASARNWKTKNLESALKALSIAKHKHDLNFQTVVYGPIEGLEAACASNDFYELNIVRLGYVPAKELGMLFRHAALFLMPSLYEGFGLPVLEAMSCGCPVITSNSGALGELAGNGAQTFSPQDVKGMADAAASLLRNPDEAAKWRKRALIRAADFSWEKAAEETANVYCGVYKTGAAARSPRQVNQQIELGGTREKSCEHSSRV
jgi:glycosyltransferase involved in cell wall biosynthesis